ncbi:uncharacterized protein [Asterias amurensis]|uniref:uncharacterized protein n=1 Tax=Asterias amurensis TaxID=7602 RepID=UPI003AB3D6C7
MSLLKICVFFFNVYIMLVMLMMVHTTHGKLICACTTPACNDTGIITCNAVTSCYTQYLDRGDGSSPVTRGCIDDTTPLFCENRRPIVPDTTWPHLTCCKQPMCNADNGVVTAPTWPQKIFETTTVHVFQPQDTPHRNSNHPAENFKPRSDDEFYHPAFMIILPVITVCLFAMLIVVIAAVVRQSRSRRHRTSGEFGANFNNTGLPVANCRGNCYGSGDPYIREKFFQSVQV